MHAKALPGFAVNVIVMALFMAAGGYALVCRAGIDAPAHFPMRLHNTAALRMPCSGGRLR